jgi:hypothetical protein
MGKINIEPGSYLHGILNSGFENLLIYKYHELVKGFADIIAEHDAELNNRVISCFVNVLNVCIADNERVINDLKIVIENEKVQKGFVSMSRIKLNNLQTIVKKANCLIIDLKMMAENKTDLKYTVKSILLAYYYMHRQEFHPLPEMGKFPWVLKNIHNKLHEIYGFSANSFKNDWTPIFENKKDRINNQKNIKLAIELLNTFEDPKINEAIELANQELREAELKN